MAATASSVISSSSPTWSNLLRAAALVSATEVESVEETNHVEEMIRVRSLRGCHRGVLQQTVDVVGWSSQRIVSESGLSGSYLAIY